MTKLDTTWATAQLDNFLLTTPQVGYANDPNSNVVVFGTHMAGSDTQAAEQAYVVGKILAVARRAREPMA